MSNFGHLIFADRLLRNDTISEVFQTCFSDSPTTVPDSSITRNWKTSGMEKIKDSLWDRNK